MPITDRIVAWFSRLGAVEMAILLAFAAQVLFLIDIGQPAQMMFDETHYVPAARAIFHMTGPMNIEHPPFAKWLIGLSMAIFGDNPAGWRIIGTGMGTLTILAVYAIALGLFRDIRTAATAGVLTLLDQLVYVQARIGMLDVYMSAFLLVAIALIIHSRNRQHGALAMLVGAGLCLGLSVACKWAAIPYVAAACIGFVILRRGYWPQLHMFSGLAALGLVSLAAYFLTFTPMLFYARDPVGFSELIAFQFQMLGLQTQPLAPHTYMSVWWQWPLIMRPIWYLYEPVAGVMRGVLLIGNPAIMWGGLVAVGAALWAGFRDGAKPLLFVAALYLFAYGLWIVIPKQIGFYFYYYLPAILLSLPLAGVFQHYRLRRLPALFLATSAALFVYFFPIISAAELPGEQAFTNWTWFDSWR